MSMHCIALQAVAAKTVPRSAALMAPLRAAKKLLRALPSPFGSTDVSRIVVVVVVVVKGHSMVI